MVLEVKLKALRELHNAHAALLIHTADGQLVFDTATSRLLSGRSLEMNKGETATVTFTLDMNLRSGVFLVGFNISSEVPTSRASSFTTTAALDG